MGDVVTLYRPDPKDIVNSLDKLSLGISRGELGEIKSCVVILRDTNGDVSYRPFGDMSDDDLIVMLTKTKHHMLSELVKK